MGERIAIVTGGASGIGKAVAEALADGGDRVVVADLNAAAGNDFADAIGGHFVKADLSLRSDCKRLVDETLSHYGEVHILINNAGIQHIDPIEVFPEDTWDKMLAVMLTAPFLLTKYVWGAMKTRRLGTDRQHLLHSRTGRFALQECLHNSQTRSHRLHPYSSTGRWRARYHCECHLPGVCPYATGREPDCRSSADTWDFHRRCRRAGHVGTRCRQATHHAGRGRRSCRLPLF